jgi:NAD(P)H-dependent flavin oxidoreductase YrpB (nitropropane dioxygenase family)
VGREGDRFGDHRRRGRWLVEQGVDAVIAQGVEAGGHRGIFKSTI